MQKQDLAELSQRLSQLADALGGRTPSPAGLLVWLDTLAEAAKSHAKMPLPADVLKLSRERLSERVEKRAAENAKDNRKDWSPEELRASTEIAQRELARIRSILRRPKPSRKAWAQRLIDGQYPNAGEYAKALATRQLHGSPASNPIETESEREARLEREAIQEGV
jgi:hypothetical protein